MTLKDQRRSGVFPEHAKAKFQGALSASMRMTIPAREAIESVAGRPESGCYYFRVPPTGLVSVLAPSPDGFGYFEALRLDIEPEYPGEQPNPDMWLKVDLTPCPRCGAALVWYEAGYVPGYRVCAGLKHHHYIAR